MMLRNNISHNPLKAWLVISTFVLIFLHFYGMTTSLPGILSGDVPLVLALILVSYIGFQEHKDRQRLQLLNKNLIEAQVQLEHAEIDSISALILTEEEKDPYVRGHSKRVAHYSLAIAQKTGLPEAKCKIIERAGLLHDLGKIGIPDEILKKSGGLNGEEYTIIKAHPQRALNILEPLRFLSPEKEIILHHHERYDGRGYPQGLKGENIPLGARIVAVADTFDAMNSERSYRKNLSQDIIVAELKKNSSTQLDGALVNVFLDLLEKNPDFWQRDGGV